MKLRFEAELAMKEENTTLWYGNQSFTLQLNMAIQMLYAIEVYASKCYDNTQYHIANIAKIKTIEELKNHTEPFTIEIVGKPNLNEWMGRISPQIFIEDYEIKKGIVATMPFFVLIINLQFSTPAACWLQPNLKLQFVNQ